MTPPCAGQTELMFSLNHRDQQRAVKLCAGCVMRDECAALGRHENHGIWGGQIKQERTHRPPRPTVWTKVCRKCDGEYRGAPGSKWCDTCRTARRLVAVG